MQKNDRLFVQCVIIVFFIFNFFSLQARSPRRIRDPYIPSITCRWVDSCQTYTLTNEHLDWYPFFKLFNKDFFQDHLLPEGTVAFRYEKTKSVDTQVLKEQIDVLCAEIKQKKRKYTYFTVLQAKDFNRRKGNGLLIVKFKEYPFVVKMFIERPETFVSPYHKGFEPIFFFYLGGGMNRHLAGFTRIKNLELIKERVAQSSFWQQRVDFPRKWYWLPCDVPWIEIVGKNMMGAGTTSITQIPGTYCIVADVIEAKHTMSILDPAEDKGTILNLCNYLNLWIDPHLNNFMIEKYTGKLVLLDTEHFASNVGFKEPLEFHSYLSWYLHLAGKFMQNTFGQNKRVRRNHERPLPCMVLT